MPEGEILPFRAEAQAILANWRELERKLAEAVRGSNEAEVLQAEIHRLRDEYQRVLQAARDAQAPEPPPFPTE